jgi:hypothetical protein
LSRPALACVLDRLDLNTAGEDKALAKFFAGSELHRNPACTGVRLSPNSTRTSWIDQPTAPPPLKGGRQNL